MLSVPYVCAYPIGMYLRVTERRNGDGSSVAYYALAENVRNKQTEVVPQIRTMAYARFAPEKDGPR
jgi:hypothetical protein